MVIRYFSIALIGFCVGAASVSAYERFSFRHIEDRNSAKPDDGKYLEARRALTLENSEFIRAFGNNISTLKIDAKNVECFFFYKTSGLIYDGDDIMYCFSKKSGQFLGQQ